MSNSDPSKDQVYHLLSTASAANMCGISTRRFLTAAHAGQLGDVEILQIGEQQFVRYTSLHEFLSGKKAARVADDVDLFGESPGVAAIARG
jgi:hypothetical protein